MRSVAPGQMFGLAVGWHGPLFSDSSAAEWLSAGRLTANQPMAWRVAR